MAHLYLFSVFAILGLTLCIPVENSDQPEYIPSEPAYIEDTRDANSRIVAGWPAVDGQFPHQVSIRMVGPFGGVGACGGSILRNDWILTAAHCLARRFTYVVRFGVTNVTRMDFILDVDRSRAHIHERYNQESTAVQTDDIGLLNLDREIPYGQNIQPIRIQSSERKQIEYDRKVLTISGFGRTDDPWLGGLVSEILYWVYQVGITQQECLRWYTNSQVIREQTMCVQYYNNTSQNTCQGDSGGGLTLVDADGQLTLVGIMSFGAAIGCNTPNPSGYVRPEYYHDWITEVTGINFDWHVADLINS